MSQALHTSSTGINAGQQQINVIANNVANINTTAFKAANMTFETLYSKNLSYGSAATKEGGGTNPKQIGLGVKVGGITRNFTSGDFVSTGRDMDLMISGNGFFVVQDSEGKLYYTRDGVFSTDSEGNVVTQSGMKVVAAQSPYSNASSGETVQVPKNLRAEVLGDPGLAGKTISQLNNASITTGTIDVKVGDAEYTLTVPKGDPTIQSIIDSFNQSLDGSGVTFSITGDGRISYTGDIEFVDAESNFVGQTGISNSNPSKQINQVVNLSEMVNYNDNNTITLMSTTVDENGIIAATYRRLHGEALQVFSCCRLYPDI